MKVLNTRQVASGREQKVESPINKVSKGMEKMFVKFLFNELRKSESKVDIFGNKKKGNFFEDSLYDEYANLIAERGDFGLQKLIKEDILKQMKGK